MTVLENTSIKHLNTFGIEAKARFLAHFTGPASLGKLLADPRFEGLPKMILGGGSNVLFTEDYPGLILKNEVKGIEAVREEGDVVLVKAGAGENWHEFVSYTLNHGWYGLENLSLIPGNVGASPMQNIGAYGTEIKDIFHSLEAYEISGGAVKIFDAEACRFGYRESVFKRALKGRYIILNVTFALSKTPRVNTRYGAITAELEKAGITDPTPKDVSEAVIRIRQSKLPDPAELGNAGSFFKNPVVPEEVFKRLQKEWPEIPNYPAGEGRVKLAAGWLIEKTGRKGKRTGNCGMHKMQALVLVNYGGAKGKEIYDLSAAVKKDVYDMFGVELEREVNIL